MHDNETDVKERTAEKLVLTDDIESLRQNLAGDTFDYVDIASVETWHKSLKEWPLLNEWHEWSKR